MAKIGIIGDGKMGMMLASLLEEGSYEFLDYTKDLVNNDYDVLLDVSHPDMLENIIKLENEVSIPICIATTGYNEEQIKKIEELSKKTPVLLSSNYSLGVNLFNKILETASKVLMDDFDIEIIEMHHNQKVDSPSGTARMFFNTINNIKEYKEVNGRSGFSKREPNEIGMHSLRGGTVAGVHEVIFAGEDEVFSIKHQATSRKIFAKGMLKGAKWIVNQENGLYDMSNVLFKD
ncbi:MAG: 4-hydroxy-tetrahydrodipicolinate reductase [Bacillota bacterium]|nr:4-hydroxy-tetrahydrodipicolinate reductase [Bacillota bacterium]NLP21547.1 4-hydroxy-tetrahydrodipicolinate reductase [Erysipelotrichaceae bacterium]